MPITVHRRWNRNIQESRAPDGAVVRQQMLDQGYLALTRGPLVYATGLIDGFKIEETVRVPDAPPEQWLTLAAEQPLPVIRMDPGYRAPLYFTPYFATGGREDGAWRLTWLSLTPAATEKIL
jgi:hypothetical protein